MLTASARELTTMQITGNQTATTPTPTYTAVKTSGVLDTVTSNGTSAANTVSTVEVRENGAAASPAKPTRERDSSWLELEVCREYARHNCPRAAEDCKFAHPDPSIVVKDGHVTCCYDFLKVSRDREAPRVGVSRRL